MSKLNGKSFTHGESDQNWGECTLLHTGVVHPVIFQIWRGDVSLNYRAISFRFPRTAPLEQIDQINRIITDFTIPESTDGAKNPRVTDITYLDFNTVAFAVNTYIPDHREDELRQDVENIANALRPMIDDSSRYWGDEFMALAADAETYNPDEPVYPLSDAELIDITPGIEALTAEDIEELFVEGQPWVFYKVLTAGLGSHYGANLPWELPTKNEDGTWTPGGWAKFHHNPVMCSHGIHATTRPTHWRNNHDDRLFKIELKGIHLRTRNMYDTGDASLKVVASTGRLLEEVFWNEDTEVMDALNLLDQKHREAKLERATKRREAELALEEEARKKREEEAAQRRAERDAAALAKLEELVPGNHYSTTAQRLVDTIEYANENSGCIIPGNAEQVVATLSRFPCPHCGETGWSLKRLEKKSLSHTLFFDDGKLNDWETDENYDCDSSTEDVYSCCDNEVHYRDFNDHTWFVSGDFQDIVRQVMSDKFD